MIEEKKLKEITLKVLSLSKADQTEVIIWAHDRGLTRFANSVIHQNVAEEGVWVQVRAVLSPSTRHERFDSAHRRMTRSGRASRGARIGVASTNDISSVGLDKVVGRAEHLAKLNKIDPHFVSLPKPAKLSRMSGISENTKKLAPKTKAKIVGDMIKIAKSEKLTASGAFDTNFSEIAIANSAGIWAYHAGTSADLSTVLLGRDSSGFAQQIAQDVEKIDYIELAKRAAKKAVMSKRPIDVKPGDYEVILEPAAVSEMMLFFSWLGPNARIYHEEASFLTGKLGKKIFSDKLTIHDDPLHPQTLVRPFDYEGHPKSKLTIVDVGVFANIVYDSYHAGKHRGKNTGHALPAPNTEGPIPTHLVFEPGESSLEEMIGKVRKGILVTRFWYVRMLHHKLLNITGMTRDGTFLIENGQISQPVKNLRFTQSIPEALANVATVGKDLKLEESWGGANLVPALHISNFHFSGVTQF